MSVDYYRKRLKRAAWDWMEGHPRKKDRTDGRAEKRAARTEASREVRSEVDAFDANEERAMAALLDCEAGLCTHEAVEVYRSARAAHAVPNFGWQAQIDEPETDLERGLRLSADKIAEQVAEWDCTLLDGLEDEAA